MGGGVEHHNEEYENWVVKPGLLRSHLLFLLSLPMESGAQRQPTPQSGTARKSAREDDKETVGEDIAQWVR